MSAGVAGVQEKLNKSLNQKGMIGDTFKMLEDNTGVQRLYIAYGLGGIIVLWLAFGFGAQLLANTVGFLYPAYCSIKALESSVKNDDTQWLTYWVVFAAFSVVEYFADFIAGWVPFYWLSKCLFLVWCMAPIEANGANVIYSKVILPFFMEHQGNIDGALAKAQAPGGKAGDFLDKVTEKAKDMAAEHQLNKNHVE
jgi:receptor expression-enhancing protein 5/6